ncbi:RNA polymerase factor sigma-70 [Cesiribacter andamanensis AMV16]|uniref:RNA polymerase factor sigma-70 n=1 Tax=Cesiribacter andamanensis AMV16 TaxID=1279009 RepID=M7N259_9BACT|nr:RNA polymerase factor sigma-70 [Cesiribacter andamanensis AMV16]
MEAQRPETLYLDHEISDSQLRLLFACCAPALAPKGQLILTLKQVSGLKTQEIAHSLGMRAAAVEKALQRSKGVLQRQKQGLQVPFAETARPRLEVVQLVLYLMYSEGYSASSGADQIKKELCLEAMRLSRALLDIPALACAGSEALFALMLLHTARFGARSSSAGAITELEFQDRSLWDRDLIHLGIVYLNRAAAKATPNRYLLEAAIAAQHCLAPTFTATNWSLIRGLYQRLEAVHPSPFVRLNGCIALLYAQGPQAALASLEELATHTYLKHNHLLQLGLAKSWQLLGDTEKARVHYQQALAATAIAAEKEFISRKILELERIKA